MRLVDRLLGRKREPDPAEIFRALRAQVLATGATRLGRSDSPANDEIVAALMEWNLDGTVVTLVAIADGTVSLYFSSGGGIIGAGVHEGPRKAAEAFLSSAAKHRSLFVSTTAAPLPGEGMTRFHSRTPGGDFASEARTQDLAEGRHALSPLFYAAQDVITAVRTASPSPGAG